MKVYTIMTWPFLTEVLGPLFLVTELDLSARDGAKIRFVDYPQNPHLHSQLTVLSCGNLWHASFNFLISRNCLMVVCDTFWWCFFFF